MSRSGLLHFGLAGDQLAADGEGLGNPKLENKYKSRRVATSRECRVSSGYIIGTEFERTRDTCINFTGRIVKLVPLRF